MPGTTTTTPSLDLVALADEWLADLESQGRSKNTLAAYGAAIGQYIEFASRDGATPVLTKATARKFIVELQRRKLRAATVRLRYGGLKRFSAWLKTEKDHPGRPAGRLGAASVGPAGRRAFVRS